MTKKLNEATVCGQVAGYAKNMDDVAIKRTVSSNSKNCATCAQLEKLGGHVTCGICGRKH